MSATVHFEPEVRPSPRPAVAAPVPPLVAAFRRLAVPVATVAAPLVLGVGVALHPEGDDDDEAFVREVGHHLTRWLVAHVLLTVGFFLVFLSAGALLRLARGRGAVLTQVAAAAIALGGLVSVMETVTHGVLAYALGADSRVSTQLSTQVQLHWFHTAAGQSLEIGMALALLGLVFAGVGVLRSRAVPRWAGVLIVLAPVSILFAGGSPVASALGLLPLAVGFAVVARAAARAAA
jgi:hypothetical protein